uniref:SFRICE_030871 n=1 Tax=Spodoptera frugiperda TaxID=7108 RepID=A0A2H1WF38_SPOFR
MESTNAVNVKSFGLVVCPGPTDINNVRVASHTSVQETRGNCFLLTILVARTTSARSILKSFARCVNNWESIVQNINHNNISSIFT